MSTEIIKEAEEVLIRINKISESNGVGTYVSKEAIKEEMNFGDDTRRLNYILDECLTNHMKVIVPDNQYKKKFKILPEGYIYLHKLYSIVTESKSAFCALWFNESMDEPWTKAIKPAIEDSNYEAIRIDDTHHNNDINAEMLKYLNSCKFVVADFTENRPCVYYEAGLARGMRKEVIYTCNKKSWESEKPHFDVEHYLFILWEMDKLDEFRQSLSERITHTIIENSANTESK